MPGPGGVAEGEGTSGEVDIAPCADGVWNVFSQPKPIQEYSVDEYATCTCMLVNLDYFECVLLALTLEEPSEIAPA
jgi:hypothetical protein